jgi:hypothetical protein
MSTYPELNVLEGLLAAKLRELESRTQRGLHEGARARIESELQRLREQLAQRISAAMAESIQRAVPADASVAIRPRVKRQV